MAKKKTTKSAPRAPKPARGVKTKSKPAKAAQAKPAKAAPAKASKPAKAAKPARSVKAVAVKTVNRTKPVKPSKPAVIGFIKPKPAFNGFSVPDEVKLIKSPLARKELGEFRKLLRLKRAEILGDMKSMSTEALRGDSANLSHMPIHMADVGSDNYEQELTLGLVESERALVTEIDEALKRIDDGVFGVCQATGKPIGKARLAAKPWAKYCIEAAREMERTGRRFG